jgi:hypothetical protein
MEHEFYQLLKPGDLVFMRYFDDELGWITSKDTTFMILGVERSHDGLAAPARDKVRFSGGGFEGETLSGHFVRCEEEKNEEH